MDKIKEGDVVELKSGGCHMTVSAVYKDRAKKENATCRWHDTSFVPYTSDYEMSTLKLVKEETII